MDMSTPDPEDHFHTDFVDTQPLVNVLNAETNALISGDLGDPSYSVDTAIERLELIRSIEHSRQPAGVVVLGMKNPDSPELLLNFSSNLFGVNEQAGTMEFDLPMAAPHIGPGRILRGSVKLQGVLLTFEAETLTTRSSGDSKENALVTRLPSKVFRLQRRDNFRVPVPKGTGLEVTLQQGVSYLEKLRILDLSCGGVSLLVRAPTDEVHVGSRFPKAQVTLKTPEGSVTHEAEILVRHARSAPPALSHLINELQTSKTPSTPSSRFRESAMAALGANKSFEVMQLGMEFGRMPMSLDRSLAKLVNELAISLMARIKDDY